jgi:Flp pilus assembly protein TadB
MPLWAWFLVLVAVVLVPMWVHDRRAKARGSRLNDPGSMARAVSTPQGDPEAHRPLQGPAANL